MRNTFIDSILEVAPQRKDLFIITGDAGLGVFDKFKESSPDKFLNLGIAEQNTTSFAAGMALSGHKVYVYNIIPFVLYRCYEQVRNDICYQNLPVVLVGIGSGVTYAPSGMTHYAIEDLGVAQTLPGLTVLSPCDPVEARQAALYSLECPGPVYVRLAKRGEPVFHKDSSFDIRQPQVLRPGSKVAIVFHGSIAEEVFKAAELLAAAGIAPRLISIPMIQPFQSAAVAELLQDCELVISLEEHFENSGMGNLLRCLHSESGAAWKLKVLGISYHYIHEIKDTAGMRDYFGLSGQKVAELVRRELKS